MKMTWPKQGNIINNSEKMLKNHQILTSKVIGIEVFNFFFVILQGNHSPLPAIKMKHLSHSHKFIHFRFYSSLLASI